MLQVIDLLHLYSTLHQLHDSRVGYTTIKSIKMQSKTFAANNLELDYQVSPQQKLQQQQQQQHQNSSQQKGK